MFTLEFGPRDLLHDFCGFWVSCQCSSVAWPLAFRLLCMEFRAIDPRSFRTYRLDRIASVWPIRWTKCGHDLLTAILTGRYEPKNNYEFWFERTLSKHLSITNLFFRWRRLRWLLLWCESVSLLWCFDPDKLLFIDEADCMAPYDSFWCRCASFHWLFESNSSIDPVDFRCPEKLRARLPSLSDPDSLRRWRERCRRCLRCCDRPEPRDNSLSLSDVRRLRCRCLPENMNENRSRKKLRGDIPSISFRFIRRMTFDWARSQAMGWHIGALSRRSRSHRAWTRVDTKEALLLRSWPRGASCASRRIGCVAEIRILFDRKTIWYIARGTIRALESGRDTEQQRMSFTRPSKWKFGVKRGIFTLEPVAVWTPIWSLVSSPSASVRCFYYR